MSDVRFRLAILAVVVLAIAVRGAAMARGPGRFDDPDNYLRLARSIADGQGLSLAGRPTAYRPPLYPMLLAPFVALLGDRAIAGVAVLHLFLGAGTTLLTAAAARAMGLSRGRSIAAALIVACDPVLISQSRSIMTETTTAFFMALALLGVARARAPGAILAGAGAGLAALTRPSALPGALLVAIAWSIAGRRKPPGFVPAALYLATTFLVIAPWAARNLWVFGEPVWTTTHGGYTLALANNPTYYRDVLHARSEQVWTGHDQWLWFDQVNRRTAGMTEPQADRYLRNEVVELARARPVDFLAAAVDRLARFWAVAPSPAVYSRGVRAAVACWTIPLWIALVLGLIRPRAWRWPRAAAALVILGLVGVHALYWTDMRMRAPLVPAIALAAAGASFRFRTRSDDDR